MAVNAMSVTPSGKALGASVTGVDLSKPLSTEDVAAIRSAWLEHLVLAFPGQKMNHADLERFTQYFGPFGDDPFIAPIDGHPHIIEVKREANEKASVFCRRLALGLELSGHAARRHHTALEDHPRQRAATRSSATAMPPMKRYQTT